MIPTLISQEEPIYFRCSQLAKIMSDGKQKAGLTEKQEEYLCILENKARTPKQEIEYQELLFKKDWKPEYDLSEGAKTYVRSIVRGVLFGYKESFSSKETIKGQMVENDSIRLYNRVLGVNAKKNKERKRNEFIQGECDLKIIELDQVTDIKSSWSKETFPFLQDEIDVGGYEWQGRGYMMLENVSKFQLAFCLVNTPPSLLTYETNFSIHYVDDIEEEFRVTTMDFERDLELEKKIEYKVTEARRYACWYEQQLIKKYEKRIK